MGKILKIYKGIKWKFSKDNDWRRWKIELRRQWLKKMKCFKVKIAKNKKEEKMLMTWCKKIFVKFIAKLPYYI